MKHLPIGKQEFRELIEGDFVYVDKTEHLVKLASTSIPRFLSRPRRFGKSLTISTLKELFSGSRDLFKNTYAFDNWDFNRIHPVITLDLSTVTGESKPEINRKLLRVTQKAAIQYGVSLPENSDAADALEDLIIALGQNGKVVVLVDEYDAPILDNLQSENLIEIKKILRSFFKILKANEAFIRFLFITGISKFGQVGIFSALNNLSDISLSSRFSTIVGYTQEEIETVFSERIEKIESRLALDEHSFRDKLKQYYNGYSWDGEHFVYNPFSVLNFLEEGRFKPYWMSTGSPGFIVEYTKGMQLDISTLEGMKVYDSFMDKKDIDTASPESFLTQAGYLTIKNSSEDKYTLGFPNHEVRRTFNDLLITERYDVKDSDILNVAENLIKALSAGDTKEIVDQFKVIFSSIPYMYFDSNKSEHFYSAVLLMYLQAAGFDADPERIGNKGRLDLSLKYENRVYIFELKTDKPSVAIRQIREKNYGGKYANFQVVNVGLQIDIEERNIIDWKAEEAFQ